MIVPSPPARRRSVPVITATVRGIVILGCDLSLTSTGWCVLDGDKVTTGRIRSKHMGLARLADLRHQLWNLIDEHKPTDWAVEGYSFGSKNTRAHSTGEWGGTAKLVLQERMPGRGHIIAPTTVKKFVTGDAHAKKSAMPLGVFKRWGVDVSQEDEADAVGIAKTLQAYLAGPDQHCVPVLPPLTEFQRDALGWGKAKKKSTPVEKAA